MQLKSVVVIGLASTFLITACEADDMEESDTVNVTEEVIADEEMEPADKEDEETGEEEMEEDEESEEEPATKDEVKEESTDNDREIVVGEPMKIGDYLMTVQSYSISEDYEGNDALVITYDWINNSEEATSPFMTFIFKAFQNNVETSDVFMVDGVDLESGQKEVRPEGEIKGAQTAVGIEDMGSIIELELDLLFSFDSDPYMTTIDLSSLE